MRVHPAGVQDRDGAPDVIGAALVAAPALARIFADGGCSGPKLRARFRRAVLSEGPVDVTKKPKDPKGFAVCPVGGLGADLRPVGAVSAPGAGPGASRRELLGLASARRLPVFAWQGCGIGMIMARMDEDPVSSPKRNTRLLKD